MQSEKLHLKLFVKSGRELALSAFVPIFHRFIRDHVLDELLIDVANYEHVKNGPGIVLVGDANDYYLDQGEGRPGLLFSRKRHGAGPEKRLREALARTLRMAQLLEGAPELDGKLGFDTGELQLRLPDRLNAPNDDASYSALVNELTPLADTLYGASSYALERGATGKAALSLRVRAQNAPPLPALLRTLGA